MGKRAQDQKDIVVIYIEAQTHSYVCSSDNKDNTSDKIIHTDSFSSYNYKLINLEHLNNILTLIININTNILTIDV